MADSLVDLILGVVDPDVVTKLAAGTGMNPVTAQNAVNAAVPAILGSIASTVSTADGARRIAEAVTNQDPAIMDNLAASAGTTGQSALAMDGTRLLGNLIGTQKLESIASAIAGANGTAPAAVKSLMGYLTPVTLGVIGQQDPSTWSDGAAIASSFAAQKSAIAEAMPAGLAAAMGTAGAALGSAGAAAAAASAGVSLIGAAASSAAASAANAVPPVPKMRPVEASTEGSGGVPSWVWIVAAVVILGALAYYFTRPGTPKMADKPAVAVTQAVPAPPAAAVPAKPVVAVPAAPVVAVPAAPVVAVPAVPAAPALALPAGLADLGKQATAALDGVKATIAGVKDADTAKLALPKLAEATSQLDKVSGLVGAMPAEAKKTIAGVIAPALPELNGQIDKMLALPGVGDVAKPAVDALRARLATLTGA